MSIRPSTPEIITVNSEDLQSQIRDLLPSQNGFGSELQASNVITPIIDLTRTAEGSTIGDALQQSLNFGGATVITVTAGNTQDVASSPGFYRLTVNVQLDPTSGSGSNAVISMTDGLSVKNVLRFGTGTSTDDIQSFFIDEIFWVSAGETLTCNAATLSTIFGSIRQVADSTGTLTNPAGFPL